MPKVCIDPGHGGTDPGAVGTNPFRLEEKSVNLDVGLLLEGELEASGHWVVVSRRQDRSLGLHSRAEYANRLAADLFVSVHANAAYTPTVSGFEVFHHPGSPRGKRLATHVLENLAAAMPSHRNRGVKEANYAVLRLTRMPAILVELEFLTHPARLEFLADAANQHLLANAVANGVHSAAQVLF